MDFALSPGITPAIVDVVVLEFPVAVAAGLHFAGRRGVLAAFALNSVGLGAYKFATDYTDFWDAVLALAAVALGLVILAVAMGRPLPGPWPAWTVVGVIAMSLAAIKVRTDFYDPFDLLLSVVLGLLGVYVLHPMFRRSDASRRTSSSARPDG